MIQKGTVQAYNVTAVPISATVNLKIVPKQVRKYQITDFETKLRQRNEALTLPKQIVKKQVNYDDGGKYEGYLYNGKREGFGTYTFPNGDYYKGLWSRDQFSGVGYYKYAQHRKAYIGEFLAGKHHGEGALVLDDNTSPIVIYQGQWENGLKHGNGVYFYYPELKEYYQGNWVHGQKSGSGIYYKDGAYYQGQWLNNERNGQGTFTTKDGTTYSGNWRNNKLEKAKVIYPKPSPTNPTQVVFDQYQGDISNGLRNGKGVYTYADGGYYEGTYVNDQRHGQGTQVRQKSLYKGEFVRNKKHGLGVFTYNSGDRFEGSFSDGKKHGPNCKYQWTDGSQFVGSFENDAMWEGVYVDSKDNIKRNVSKGQILA